MTQQPPLAAIQEDWFLREWLEEAGKRQADIARELGWERGRISKLVTGRQPYARGDVNALADWLGIRPFELLMLPAEAIALRRLRDIAAQLAADAAFDLNRAAS